jgi:hypothetical protein
MSDNRRKIAAKHIKSPDFSRFLNRENWEHSRERYREFCLFFAIDSVMACFLNSLTLF